MFITTDDRNKYKSEIVGNFSSRRTLVEQQSKGTVKGLPLSRSQGIASVEALSQHTSSAQNEQTIVKKYDEDPDKSRGAVVLDRDENGEK